MGARCNGRAHILITRRSRGAGRRRVIRWSGEGGHETMRWSGRERPTHTWAAVTAAAPPPHPPHKSVVPMPVASTADAAATAQASTGYVYGRGGDVDGDDENRDDDGATNGRAQTVRPPRPPRRLLCRFIRIKQ